MTKDQLDQMGVQATKRVRIHVNRITAQQMRRMREYWAQRNADLQAFYAAQDAKK